MTAALRTSRSMLPDTTMDLGVPATPPSASPLGYLYCNVDPRTIDGSAGDLDMGHYDPESQTWVDGDVITAGVYTTTRIITSPNKWDHWYDYPTDDACQ